MNDVSVITPPDILYNNVYSILIIYPDTQIKQALHDILQDSNDSVNIYLYEPAAGHNDIEWLIKVSKISELIILNLDSCNIETKEFASFLISLPKTFYLTNDHITPYNLISNNRIYDLNWLKNVFNNRGNNE